MPSPSTYSIARFCFMRFQKQIKSAVKQYFLPVEPHVVYFTEELLSATNKDVLPALQKSNVIYQFLCHCDISRYVVSNSQRLQDRIEQHVPKPIHFGSSSQKRMCSGDLLICLFQDSNQVLFILTFTQRSRLDLLELEQPFKCTLFWFAADYILLKSGSLSKSCLIISLWRRAHLHFRLPFLCEKTVR